MKKDTYAILVAIWCVGSLAATATGVKLVCLAFALLYFILQCLTKE